MREAQKKHPQISVLIVLSDVEGKRAYKHKEKTGRPGRPRMIIDGPKVRLHVHVVICGVSGVSSFAQKIMEGVNKKAGKSIAKKFKRRSAYYIQYLLKQGKKIRRVGPFNFNVAATPWFVDITEDERIILRKKKRKKAGKKPV